MLLCSKMLPIEDTAFWLEHTDWNTSLSRQYDYGTKEGSFTHCSLLQYQRYRGWQLTNYTLFSSSSQVLKRCRDVSVSLDGWAITHPHSLRHEGPQLCFSALHFPSSADPLRSSYIVLAWSEFTVSSEVLFCVKPYASLEKYIIQPITPVDVLSSLLKQ